MSHHYLLVFLTLVCLQVLIVMWLGRRVLHAQRDLQDRSAQLRTLVGCMEDVAYTVDKDLRVTYVAGAAVAAYVPRAEIMSGASVRYLFGAGAELHEEACKRAIAGEKHTYEWTWPMESGPVHFITSVSPLRDAAGQIIGALGIGRNVTGQRMAEEALEESNQELRALISASPLGIITLSPAGTVLSGNPAATAILGWSELELLGRPCPLGRGTSAPRWAGVLGRVLTGEALRSAPFRTHSRSGEPLDLHVSAAALPGNGGQVGSILLLLADVTREVQSRQRLSRYQLLASHSSEIMLFAGAGGRILEANLAAEAAYRQTRDSLCSMSIRDLYAGGDFAHLLAGASDGGSSLTFETSHRRGDGSTFPAEVSAHGSQVDGEPVVLMLVRDITSRRFGESLRSQLRPLGAAALAHSTLREALREVCAGLAEVTGSRLVCACTLGEEGLLDPLIWAWWGPPELERAAAQWAAVCAAEPAVPVRPTAECHTYSLSDPDAPPDHVSGLLAEGVTHFTLLRLSAAGKTVGAFGFAWNHAETTQPSRELDLVGFAAELAAAVMDARAQEEIRFLMAVMQQTDTGVLISDRRGIVRWANQSFTRLTGYALGEVLGRSTRDMLESDRNPASLSLDLWQTISAGGTWRGEIVTRRKDGSAYRDYQVVTPVTGAGGQPTHFMTLMYGIATQAQHEANRQFVARHDPVTRLPNRRALLQDLSAALTAPAQGENACLLVLDLDGFGPVNSTMGRAVSDQVVSAVALAILPHVQPRDSLARVGPGEFALLLAGATAETARPVAEQLRQTVRGLALTYGGHVLRLTACVGLTDVTGPAHPETVLNWAEEALLQARRLGPDRVGAHTGDQFGGPSI